MVKLDNEATVDHGSLNQTWKSKKEFPWERGRPARNGGHSGRLGAGEDACTTRFWCGPLACTNVQTPVPGPTVSATTLSEVGDHGYKFRFSSILMIDVLFVCIGNACRSPMAEGFANYYAKGLLKAHSAGSRPAGFIMPSTIEVMQEKGIDISHQMSKGLTAVDLERMAWIINLEVSLEKVLRPASRRTQLEHWFIPDPVGQSLDTYRAVRDEIEVKVLDFIQQIQEES